MAVGGIVWLVETIGAVSGLYASGSALFDYLSTPSFTFSNNGFFPITALILGVVFAPLAVAEMGCWLWNKLIGDCARPSQRDGVTWGLMVVEAIATFLVLGGVIYLVFILSPGLAEFVLAIVFFLLAIAYFFYLLARFGYTWDED